jgi:hypothetical protein
MATTTEQKPLCVCGHSFRRHAGSVSGFKKETFCFDLDCPCRKYVPGGAA